MKVLLFGSYDLHQNCNITKIEALKSTGVGIKECREEFPLSLRQEKTSYNFSKLIIIGIKLFFNQIKLFAKYLKARDYDVMLVLYPGHADMVLAKILTRFSGKKLVFYPFISAYQTLVFQRKFLGKNSLKTKFFFLLDKISCMLADKVLLDSNAKIDYFSKTFNLDKKKFERIFLGAPSYFYQKNAEPNKKFTILFYGSFIQSEDLDLLVETAKLLKNEKILFKIIGKETALTPVKEIIEEDNLKNIDILGFQPITSLILEISKADVCMGLLSPNKKTDIVIANKVFEALAMKKVVINFKSTAIQELLKDKESVILCEPNPKSIAESILLLKTNENLRERIAKNGYEVYKKNCSAEALGKKLSNILQ